MQSDEFIGKVQQRARLHSRGEAERAIAATLSTLADRLAGGTAENLAAQLPADIGRHLQSHAGDWPSLGTPTVAGGGSPRREAPGDSPYAPATATTSDVSPAPTGASPERLSPTEFFERIAQREGVDAPAAAFHARAVLEVLKEATAGALDKAKAQLPDEFDALFAAGSHGEMRLNAT